MIQPIRVAIRKSAPVFAIAAALSLLPLPMLAMSGGGVSTPSTASGATSMVPGAGRVPAQAILSQKLDAKKLQPGASFQAKLDGKVKLTDGTELPSGTLLRGTVAADDMNIAGNSKLALRFTAAKLKNGESLPIRATIVGLQTPANEMVAGSTGYAQPTPNDWTPATTDVDEINVISGVDLHSSLSSQNSGVFVSHSKDDVKLDRGSAVNLAVAAVRSSLQPAGE